MPGRFWLFFAGQTISELGSAFTAFLLPLLVFRFTGSAVDLGVASAVAYLPWVCFGLLGGALVDRVDRRRTMITADVLRAVAICAVPVAFLAGTLNIGIIYTVLAVQATLQIVFDSASSPAIVALVDTDSLGTANSRLSSSQSGATIAGAGLAGLLLTVAPIPDTLGSTPAPSPLPPCHCSCSRPASTRPHRPG